MGGKPVRDGSVDSAPPESSSETLARTTLDALRRIVAALRAGTSASERAVGLSTAQLFVLRQLHAEPEQSLGDIARRTRTTQSSVSEVVGRLVKQKLVSRVASGADRRRAVLTVTPLGRSVVARAPETVQDRLVAGFTRLDPSTQGSLANGMEAWLAASGLIDVTPTLFFEEPNDEAGGAAIRTPS